MMVADLCAAGPIDSLGAPNRTHQRASAYTVFQSVPVRKRRKVAKQANEVFFVRGGNRD
jgi:hypothetical protein